MKQASLSYRRSMPVTPVTPFVGPSGWLRACRGSSSGTYVPADTVPAPYYRRKFWCELSLHLDGITLCFATPLELDEVCGVLSQNPLPSVMKMRGTSALNSHWLSRLPKQAKTTKWRNRFLKFVKSEASVKEFRAFYSAAA